MVSRLYLAGDRQAFCVPLATCIFHVKKGLSLSHPPFSQRLPQYPGSIPIALMFHVTHFLPWIFDPSIRGIRHLAVNIHPLQFALRTGRNVYIYKVLPSSPISYNLFEGDMLVSVDPFTSIFSQARSRSMPSSTSYELHSLKHGGGCKDGCVWPSQRCALDARASPLQLMALLQSTSISGFEGLRLPMKRPHKLIEKSPSFSSHPLLGIGSRSASLEYKLGWDARMSVQS